MAPRYHIVELGLIEPRAEATRLFCRRYYLLVLQPAPEANHAVKGAIDEALRCKEEGVGKTILFNPVVMVTSICRRTFIRRGCA